MKYNILTFLVTINILLWISNISAQYLPIVDSTWLSGCTNKKILDIYTKNKKYSIEKSIYEDNKGNNALWYVIFDNTLDVSKQIRTTKEYNTKIKDFFTQSKKTTLSTQKINEWWLQCNPFEDFKIKEKNIPIIYKTIGFITKECTIVNRNEIEELNMWFTNVHSPNKLVNSLNFSIIDSSLKLNLLWWKYKEWLLFWYKANSWPFNPDWVDWCCDYIPWRRIWYQIFTKDKVCILESENNIMYTSDDLYNFYSEEKTNWFYDNRLIGSKKKENGKYPRLIKLPKDESKHNSTIHTRLIDVYTWKAKSPYMNQIRIDFQKEIDSILF